MSNFLNEEEHSQYPDEKKNIYNIYNTHNNNNTTTTTTAVNSVMEQSCMLFLVSSRAMEAVSQNAINLLSNQIFFFSDLRTYFLLSFHDHIINNKKEIKNSTWNNRHSNLPDITQPDSSHSPIEIICATLTDFFQFISQHINEDDIEKLLYICIKKVIIRYLIFLRDLIILLPQHNNKNNKNKRNNRKSFTGSSNIEDIYETENMKIEHEKEHETETERNSHEIIEDHNNYTTTSATTSNTNNSSSIYEESLLTHDQISKIKADVKSIIRLHSILKLKIQQATTTTTVNANTDGGWQDDAASDTDREEREYHTFFNNSAANLFGIVSDVANRLMMGELTDTGSVDEVVYNYFSITVRYYY